MATELPSQSSEQQPIPALQDVSTLITELRDTAGKSSEPVAAKLNQLADSLEADLSAEAVNH
jgi:hypothetical protein